MFYQLIVRLHKYSLGRNNYNDSIHWQRGLMLDNDYNGRALLEHIGNDVKFSMTNPTVGISRNQRFATSAPSLGFGSSWLSLPSMSPPKASK
ncbi:hypothetical protein [Leptolyngbya sp. KIOST-1]|uniref:hypothetical protein n=1 Tax=Leptolyngbya sp. KIOST-1 TaxID=1229172 RepID=UPI000ACA04AF|nr:hypothetical protein [Leptolyngbya sp. KIOST-1]